MEFTKLLFVYASLAMRDDEVSSSIISTTGGVFLIKVGRGRGTEIEIIYPFICCYMNGCQIIKWKTRDTRNCFAEKGENTSEKICQRGVENNFTQE